jgi:hypothetical protein
MKKQEPNKFAVRYLPAKKATSQEAINALATTTQCKREPLFESREAAQARCDEKNGAGEKLFHVAEVTVEPKTEKKNYTSREWEFENAKADAMLHGNTESRAERIAQAKSGRF